MVPCVKTDFSQPDRCHDNVKDMTRHHGGSAQQGWSIRVLEGAAVWMELHSVWRHPEGHLLCVTEPPSAHLQKIAFLPDSSMDATRSGLPSLHFPWSDDPLCRDYVEQMYALDRLFFPVGDPYRTRDRIDEAQVALVKNRMREIRLLLQNQMKKAQQVETRNPH